MKITITFDVPDGTTVDMGTLDPLRPYPVAEPQYVPPFEDQLIPLPPEAIPVAGDPVFRGAAQNAPQDAYCPVHRVAWHTVPAGVSKKTGKPYGAFWGCPDKGCQQRPSYAFVQAHPV